MLNKIDLSKIIAQLKYFGCTNTEAKLYVECLQLGPASIQEIARKTSMNRVTVHSAIEHLLKKGLIFETRKGKRRLIVGEKPEILNRLLQTKQEDLELAKDNLNHITDLLNSIKTQSRNIPSVKFYEGIAGFKKMLEETLSTKNEIRVFVYVDLFAKLLGPTYLENYFKRRAAKGIHTRLIFPPCPFAEKVNKKAQEYKIQVRLLPPHLIWTSGIFSWDNSLALMSYTEEHLTCTIIENKDIAFFYKEIIFELCWQQAKPIQR